MPTQARGGKNYNDETLLQAELEYITQTVFQANEDRARVSTFYLVGVGSIVAALFSTQLVSSNVDPRLLTGAFSGLFFVLTVLGSLTTLQLARLRAAWHDSVLAMNQIKEYWLRQSKDRQLRQAFRWDANTMPARYKTSSVSYYQVLEVALLSGLTFGSGVYFLQRALGYTCVPCNWAYTSAAGALAFLFQLVVYKRTLEDHHAS
jgi:hypothetical protein